MILGVETFSVSERFTDAILHMRIRTALAALMISNTYISMEAFRLRVFTYQSDRIEPQRM